MSSSAGPDAHSCTITTCRGSANASPRFEESPGHRRRSARDHQRTSADGAGRARNPCCEDSQHLRHKRPHGDREATRRMLGFDPDDVVLLQPTRAIERKNLPGGLRFAAELDALMDRRVRYWITGPAEEDYGRTLAALLNAFPLECTVGRVERVADAYAAADVVVFPSTVEGFGNPIVETALAGRLLVVGSAPLVEFYDAGLRWFTLGNPDEVAAWLVDPDQAALERNREVAVRNFSLSTLPDRIARAFEGAGWSTW
ncbi:MAG: glycosyltransferase [Acidimicrobiia bacterium]|nr:glycosyltransferase [Acidimicrobiia bacterium]